jgi:hypothetical protein
VGAITDPTEKIRQCVKVAREGRHEERTLRNLSSIKRKREIVVAESEYGGQCGGSSE